MGTYISESDLIPDYVEERLAVQLTNDEPDGDTVVAAVVTSVIADAEAEVDGYLGVHYALPLASTPRLVQQLAARVARYRLYTRRPGAVEDWLLEDYKNALSLLKELATGKVTLGIHPEPTPNSGRTVRTNSVARTFGRDNLKGF